MHGIDNVDIFVIFVCYCRDGQSPLHLACAWGLERVVQCLMEHNADVNSQVGQVKDH